MKTTSHTATSNSGILVLALTVGLVTWLASPGAGLAAPKQGTSCDATGKDKGLNACADSPGHIIVCTSGGDYMCCKITPTGKECEEIVKDSEAALMGKFKGSQLQLTPMTPAPKTSPFLKGGTNAPIMRRGVEGEQPTTPPAASGQTAPSGEATK